MLTWRGRLGLGGEGSDDFILGQWLAEGGHATITDFDGAEDEIVLVYDPSVHTDPQVTLAPVEGTDQVQILLDGDPVATVHGTVDPEAIRLLAA